VWTAPYAAIRKNLINNIRPTTDSSETMSNYPQVWIKSSEYGTELKIAEALISFAVRQATPPRNGSIYLKSSSWFYSFGCDEGIYVSPTQRLNRVASRKNSRRWFGLLMFGKSSLRAGTSPKTWIRPTNAPEGFKTQPIDMDAPSKPVWKELHAEIRNAWILQTHAFYPLGSTTIAEATELAQYEYEQSEPESLYPPVESAAEVEIGWSGAVPCQPPEAAVLQRPGYLGLNWILGLVADEPCVAETIYKSL
jgi:hypothetical protein